MPRYHRRVAPRNGAREDRSGVVLIEILVDESLVEVEYQIADLGELQTFFDKIATIKMHADWGKQMSEVIVSGSTYWEVLRVVE